MKNPSIKRLTELAIDFASHRIKTQADHNEEIDWKLEDKYKTILGDFIQFVFEEQSEAEWRKDSLK